MEDRFGYDFGDVRVHTDARAAESAAAINAAAYTLGADVVFGNSRYAPSTLTGQHLLAHELTHVVQQASATAGPVGAVEVSRPDDPSELEAGAVADAVIARSTPRIQRSPGCT